MDPFLRMAQEAELEKLHRIVSVSGSSGTAVTTDYAACQTVALREVAMGAARDCRCIAAREPLAFVGVAHGGVAVLDIADPAKATVIGGILIPGTEPTSLALHGTMLYVSDRASGFHAIDMSNPRRPVHTLSHPAQSHTQKSRVLVDGNLLVFVDDHAFSVFDLADPKRPAHVARHHRMRSGVGFFRGGAFANQQLHLTQGALGLWTFDLSIPARPRALVGQAISLDSRPHERLVADSLALWRDHLFVGTSSGVWVLHARANEPPATVTFFTGPGFVREAQGDVRGDAFRLGVFESYDHAFFHFDLAAGPRYLGRQRLSRAVDKLWGFAATTTGCTLSAAGMQGVLVTNP